MACKGDDNMTPISLNNSVGNCDIQIPAFYLNEENAQLSSYDAYNKVAFINSQGEEKSFQIGQSVKTLDEGLFEDIDSTKYCFTTESIETSLINNKGLEFTIIIETKPYFADVKSSLSADILKIFYNDTMNGATDRRLVFRKVLDLKDYPSALYQTTVDVPSKYFVDNEFKNLEITNFNSPVIRLYFNDNLGIVAYEDENKVLWQFSNKM